MHRAMRTVVIGLASVTLLGVTAAGAYATAAAPAATACTATNAPTAMNDLPATADCGTPVARSGLARIAAAVTSTTPVSMTPLSFDHTNGDILAITRIAGTSDIAFSGNFSLVYTPDGVSHAVNDFAVVDEATGTILYTGNPRNGSSSDRYPRSITSLNGAIYVGGDFTSWDGSTRSHAVKLTPTGNPAPGEFAVASWNPAPGSTVRGMVADSSAVYLGIEGSALRAVDPTTGATIWSKSVSGGDIHSVFEDQGYVFAGGLFETYNGVTQHGLVKVQPSNGSLVTAFNAHLRADSGVGSRGSYDGEEVLSMAAPSDASEILIGVGGHAPTTGTLANETVMLNFTTGARVWTHTNLGDGQAVGAAGDTAIAGYHNNSSTSGDPTSANYFGVQLEDTNGAVTSWDPRINGNQGNADGGNNGVQGMYVDPDTKTIYLAGAFVHWNGTTGTTYQSLIAFSFGSGTPPTAPAPPTAVSATAGDKTATVSWQAPSNGGSPITGYTVTSSPAGGTATTTGATSVVVPGLTDGTSYTFTVTATNGVGTSKPSTPSNSVTPQAPTDPDPPTNVTATAGNAQASVSWQAASNGGSPITGYTVTSNPAGGTATTTGATSTTVTGLTNGTSYTFIVTATNGVGTSGNSGPSNSVIPTASTGQSNTAEGGTSGASVTTANSGGASGDAFTVVGKGSGATIVFSTAAADHGTLGYAVHGSSGTATLMGWNGYNATSMAIRFYYNPGPTLPSTVMRLADIRNSSATAARVELSASNQLFIQNTAGKTLTTFPDALQANTWYRIELTISVSGSAASINAAYYPADSTTPVDPPYSTTVGDTGTTNITEVAIGSPADATWTGTSYFDDLAADAGSTAFIGPS